jgi:cytoskeletal protein RodZ
MKKSSGKQSRIHGLAIPAESKAPQVRKKIVSPYKKKSRKKYIILLLLLLAASLFFTYIVVRNKFGAKARQGALSGVREMQGDVDANPKKNSRTGKAGKTLTKNEESSRNAAGVKPVEKKVYDFGTTLKLDPPPVRD